MNLIFSAFPLSLSLASFVGAFLLVTTAIPQHMKLRKKWSFEVPFHLARPDYLSEC